MLIATRFPSTFLTCPRFEKRRVCSSKGFKCRFETRGNKLNSHELGHPLFSDRPAGLNPFPDLAGLRRAADDGSSE